MKILRCILYSVWIAIAVCKKEKITVMNTMAHALDEFEEIRGEEGTKIRNAYVELALNEQDESLIKKRLLDLLDDMSENGSEKLKEEIETFRDSAKVLTPSELKEVMEHIEENRGFASIRKKRGDEKNFATKSTMDVTVTPGSMDEEDTTSDVGAFDSRTKNEEAKKMLVTMDNEDETETPGSVDEQETTSDVDAFSDSKRRRREVKKLPANKGKMNVTQTPGSADEQEKTSDTDVSSSPDVDVTTSNSTLSDVTSVL